MARPYDQVVLFGDSLLQGASEIQDGFSFQAALQHRCMRRLDVVNRGLSGYNSSHALKHLPEIFQAPTESGPRLAYLVVLFGANDAVLPMATTIQHVPMDEFRANLQVIVTHPLISAHAPKILLVTPPPLDEIRTTVLDLAAGHAASQRQATVSAAYSQVVRDVAAANPGAVQLVDLHRGVMERAVAMTPGFDAEGGASPLGYPEGGQRGGLQHLLPDGLHMSGEAYRVFYDIVAPHIGGEWEDLPADDRLGYVLPDWKVARRMDV